MALSLLIWPLGTSLVLAALVSIPWALGCFSSNSAQQARLVAIAPALASASDRAEQLGDVCRPGDRRGQRRLADCPRRNGHAALGRLCRPAAGNGASAWATRYQGTTLRPLTSRSAHGIIARMTPTYNTVGVVGAGAMGRGIAQIAAQAGSTVKLYDTQPQAVAKARDELFSQWDRLLEKGRMDARRGAGLQAAAASRRQPAGAGRLRSGGRGRRRAAGRQEGAFRRARGHRRGPTPCWRPTPRRCR